MTSLLKNRLSCKKEIDGSSLYLISRIPACRWAGLIFVFATRAVFGLPEILRSLSRDSHATLGLNEKRVPEWERCVLEPQADSNIEVQFHDLSGPSVSLSGDTLAQVPFA
jgi:hypothetical protein